MSEHHSVEQRGNGGQGPNAGGTGPGTGADAANRANGADGATAARTGGRAQKRDDSTLVPAVDVVEDATGITVFADLAGSRRIGSTSASRPIR